MSTVSSSTRKNAKTELVERVGLEPMTWRLKVDNPHASARNEQGMPRENPPRTRFLAPELDILLYPSELPPHDEKIVETRGN